MTTLDTDQLMNVFFTNKFRVMTGAKNFGKSETMLTFRIPAARNGINYITVTVQDDLYVLRGHKFGTKTGLMLRGELKGIQAEDLLHSFEILTGLYTSL